MSERRFLRLGELHASDLRLALESCITFTDQRAWRNFESAKRRLIAINNIVDKALREQETPTCARRKP